MSRDLIEKIGDVLGDLLCTLVSGGFMFSIWWCQDWKLFALGIALAKLNSIDKELRKAGQPKEQADV